ncbi:hypothetical protein [Altericroceibacterium xinjiangense]|uniref:hypothetical protein n=1 Tax=Altericroceibacterium xinjiangense TaxID=762261 RepID=UPI000F7EA646|nr:hypothetical protein [Altericroceibacterium xinjiangense]
MKYLFRLLIAVAAVATNGAAAQESAVNVLASNGVQVDIEADDFSGRAEYTAPKIELDNDFGTLFVAAIKDAGGLSPVIVMGRLYYEGDWRRYDQAVLRGGEEVKAIFGDRGVVNCSASRYRKCTLGEGFQLTPTEDQLSRYVEDGRVQVQLRAHGLYPVMLSIPVSHFEAVAEVSKQPGYTSGAPAEGMSDERQRSPETDSTGLW